MDIKAAVLGKPQLENISEQKQTNFRPIKSLVMCFNRESRYRAAQHIQSLSSCIFSVGNSIIATDFLEMSRDA